MVRKAVGAIIVFKEKYLLVKKINVTDIKNNKEYFDPTWDFPKGGIKRSDTTIETALLRELKEEIGTNKVKIIEQFKDNIRFDFCIPKDNNFPYSSQETTMFLCEFIGNIKDLEVDNIEIGNFIFLDKKRTFDKLTLPETKHFFRKHFIDN